MRQEPQPKVTGGCQCGAVRYALDAQPTETSICHCRMCQKASGNYFQAFAAVERSKFRWVRGKVGAFRSSERVEREFCRDCGTPLTYHPLDDSDIWITVGSLDQPAHVQPVVQYGIERRIIDFNALAVLPGLTTEQANAPDRLARLGTRQHPDHD